MGGKKAYEGESMGEGRGHETQHRSVAVLASVSPQHTNHIHVNVNVSTPRTRECRLTAPT